MPEMRKEKTTQEVVAQKEKAYPVGQDQGKRITNKPILLYSIEEGLVNGRKIN